MRTSSALLLMPLLFLVQDSGALEAQRRPRAAFGLDQATVRTAGSGPVARELEALRRGLLESGRIYSVRGAQVYAFRLTPGAGLREASLSFGFAHPRTESAVVDATLLPAGELVRPLVALGILSGNQDPAGPVRSPAAGIALPEGLQLQHLLSMTSGAASAETGYAAPNRRAPALGDYLTRNLRFLNEPGVEFRHSFANYALLQHVLAGEDVRLLEARLRERVFVPLGLDATVLVPGDGTASAHGMVRSGRYYFALADDTSIPGANRLFVSARSYGRFLRTVAFQGPLRGGPSPAALVQPAFAFDDRLGGSALGFSYLRALDGRLWFRQESVIPGSTALAMLVPGVGGAVVLAVPSEPAFARDLLALIQTQLFADVFSRKEISRRKLTPVFPAPPSFVPVAVGPIRAQFGELEGLYRPEGAVPNRQRLLAFMNDTRVAISSKHGLELSGVFQEEAAVELLPLQKDLFLARGNARMHGWRVRVVRDGVRVIGLESDGMRYRRVPTLLSFWGITFMMAFAFVIPAAGLLLFLVRRRRGPGHRQEI